MKIIGYNSKDTVLCLLNVLYVKKVIIKVWVAVAGDLSCACDLGCAGDLSCVGDLSCYDSILFNKIQCIHNNDLIRVIKGKHIYNLEIRFSI